MTTSDAPAVPARMQRSPLLASAVVGMTFATVVILAYSGGKVSEMTSGDGLFYRYVAAHLDIAEADLDPIVAARGPSLRYGRITLPVMIWLFSAGEPGAMPYAQPAIMIVAAGAIAAAARRLFPERTPLVSLVPFLALGLTLSVGGGYTETAAVAFVMWAVVAVRAERWVTASVLLALGMLARENAVVILIGLGLWFAWKRRWAPLAILACSILPVVAWHLVVAARFGHLPLADPYLWAGAQTTRIPFVSLAKGLVDFSAAATFTAAIHLALWLVALALAVTRRTMLALIAATAGLQLMAVPLLNWQYAGDAFRLFSFLEVFAILALTAESARDQSFS